MIDIYLMETLYRALNSITKLVVDNAIGGSFMDLTFKEASEMHDWMIKQSRAWYNSDSVVTSPVVSIGMTVEQCKKEEEHDQDMAYLNTQIDLITKHLLSAMTIKMKAVTTKIRDDSNSEEEANI